MASPHRQEHKTQCQLGFGIGPSRRRVPLCLIALRSVGAYLARKLRKNTELDQIAVFPAEQFLYGLAK